MKEKIRDLENMPVSIKLKYSKILSFMANTDNNYNQLKMTALYRIISKIKLSSQERLQLMKFIVMKGMDFHQVLKETDLHELSDQERNIFRFSLIKDLIIIMNADYIETDSEKKLLKDTQEHFNISDEQLSFFKEEYELDCCYFDESISENKLKEITKSTVSTAIALGIPLAVIYYSGSFKGLGPLGIISGLSTLGMKRRTGRHSLAVGICTSIALGVITYKTLEYILHVRKGEKSKVAKLMKEEIQALHNETIANLYTDIESYTNDVVMDETKKDMDNILEIPNLLRGVIATLENTEAMIV